MRWLNGALIIWVLGTAPSAEAGIFSRKDPGKPAERVMNLLATLRNNPDADQRQEAAGELSEFDGAAYPEIVPALINALQRDSDSGVRRAAASSLGSIKPTSVEVQQALEQASKQDESTWVRMKARMARLGYSVKSPAPPPQAAAKRDEGPISSTKDRLRPMPKSGPLPKPEPLKMPTPSVGLGKPANMPPLSEPSNAGPILDPRQAAPVSRFKPVLNAPTPAPAPLPDDGPILVPPRPPQ